MKKKEALRQLTIIPGVGHSIAQNLFNIGIGNISELRGCDPEKLYELSNRYVGKRQDRCLLYVFRCAVYFASTPEPELDAEKLKWWNWKDGNLDF